MFKFLAVLLIYLCWLRCIQSKLLVTYTKIYKTKKAFWCLLFMCLFDQWIGLRRRIDVTYNKMWSKIQGASWILKALKCEFSCIAWSSMWKLDINCKSIPSFFIHDSPYLTLVVLAVYSSFSVIDDKFGTNIRRNQGRNKKKKLNLKVVKKMWQDANFS